ncbi:MULTISPECIES: carbamate kinase [unclassified Rhizobium]|uniref:carbamate kinase n=1 Tax=unclassified Rhizobium TaxID=2613769 RepID=UPI001A996656|nr:MULTISPECIES: carbamate kinase [unclassified Rhizobium]MBX5162015.1 carbamate kinase [Rhizobium sp. NZLR4b]MBX5171111.1 carbamate kinase [Rhizobium sp. NZLR1b]MBX5181169.1 carbamate kinase [Rhizobium sp. NZLR5]MBX5188074.1 carbamate kinase [Rhizobium sp. NZLR3b]MBX5197704.1 carbamate kinase [Rhizobium sp. NZLR10]
MRIVIALGGNALLRRGEPMTADAQRRNARTAAHAIAPLAGEHEIVITHGNGPQVGLLALQGAAYKPEEAYPLDVLGAETEGMIGYMLEQELGNLLPFEQPLATLLTMVEVDAADPGFQNPTKFVGPVYEKAEADRLHAEKAWVFKQDGEKWRRVVASPAPMRIFEIRPVRWLLEQRTIVICAGGGGIPTMYEKGSDRKLIGVEAVIDKDLCSELLARELSADLLIMATDAQAVCTDWGKPSEKAIHCARPDDFKQFSFPAGSMGPKVEAACHFARTAGGTAAIGSLADIAGMVRGERGTIINSGFDCLSWH